jgi:hypothetical protein
MILNHAMKTKFTLFRRGAVYYSQDTASGKQTSLRTKDETEARSLLHALNDAQRQGLEQAALAQAEHGLVFHLQFARDFFRGINVHDCTFACLRGTPCQRGRRQPRIWLNAVSLMKLAWWENTQPDPLEAMSRAGEKDRLVNFFVQARLLEIF